MMSHTQVQPETNYNYNDLHGKKVDFFCGIHIIFIPIQRNKIYASCIIYKIINKL